MESTIVNEQQWLAARRALLDREKQMTRLRDEIAAERRRLPWLRVDKQYVFDAPEGPVTLADLFAGRSQLIVKHFMMPNAELPCVGCSFEVDHVDGALLHLQHHDVSYVAVARAPLADIEAYRRRMGWRFRWVSSHNCDFNYDFHVSYTPTQLAQGTALYNFQTGTLPMEDLSGHSVFYRNDDGEIFLTYAVFARGGEELLSTYMFLDMTPKGRNETGPRGNLTDWVRPHDRYDEGGSVNSLGQYQPPKDACCRGKASSSDTDHG